MNMIENFSREHETELLALIKELCEIPAPSFFEHERAAYCKKWLEQAGAKNVYIDSAQNVIWMPDCEESDDITVIAAHTDTVFPEKESFSCVDDGEKLHCPGVADNTAGVAVLLMVAKFWLQAEVMLPKGLMFVWNTCEEGLGNLRGTRQLFTDFEGRIGQFIALDNQIDRVSDRCVGSHRYEVEVRTKGGHSYGDFGSPNAIAVLAEVVQNIYALRVPEKAGTCTTYNVGTISGGTSVNTIAQNAGMLCEYRSDDTECLAFMEKAFEAAFDGARDKATLFVKRIGERPCGYADEEKMAALKNKVLPVIESVIGKKVTFCSMSTDCNIPLSLGIPSLCMGVCKYGGMHTKEEWLYKDSLVLGLELAIKTAISLAK